MIRFSRLGLVALLVSTVFFGSSCTYYNRVLARKYLVDGSKAYKDRKFQEAEQLFRDAVARDPEGQTVEGRLAQVFLARTLHSEYIGDRQRKDLAEEALKEYRKAIQVDPNDQSSYKAIASLLENLQRNDEWLTWVTERSKNENIAPQFRAEALVSLASKKNTCANDISDTDKTKKTVNVGGRQVFQFVKPENPDDLNTMRSCVNDGMGFIDQALSLEGPAQVANVRNVDIATASDDDLRKRADVLRVFESARSYKASLLIQSMRLAEMEGRTADRDRFKNEADAAKASFLDLSDVVKNIQAELDRRAAERLAAETGASTNVNANTNANTTK
jgi:tetratricopeptide (TPR) repeat protein